MFPVSLSALSVPAPLGFLVAGTVVLGVTARTAPDMFLGRSRIAPAVVSVALAWFLFGSHFSDAVKTDVGMFFAPTLAMLALAQLMGGQR